MCVCVCVCVCVWKYVTLDLKTSHTCTFFEIEIYTSSESFSLMYGLLWSDNIWSRYNYLKIWNLREQKNLNIEKITFKIVKMMFLAMHITNQKLSSDIFMVRNLLNIFMEHGLYFLAYFFFFFDPYNVFLAIATNIPQRHKTGFVVQGHIIQYNPFVSLTFS